MRLPLLGETHAASEQPNRSANHERIFHGYPSFRRCWGKRRRALDIVGVFQGPGKSEVRDQQSEASRKKNSHERTHRRLRPQPNSKSETRNPKQTSNPKIETAGKRGLAVGGFPFVDFGFVSDFDIRVSDFLRKKTKF
jgi:hypothetical protein